MWERNRNGFKDSEQVFESVCLASILHAITAGSIRLAGCFEQNGNSLRPAHETGQLDNAEKLLV